MQPLKHFSAAEFACRCCGQQGVDPELALMLDELRERCGFPIVISSAYRCSAHNKSVGGAPLSAHVEGYAVDIRCFGGNAHKVLEVAMEMGFLGIGIKQTGPNEKRFIHVDIAPNSMTRIRPAVWSY